VAYNVPEVVLGADLLLQVGILPGKLVLQRLDLTEGCLNLLEGPGILNSHGTWVATSCKKPRSVAS